MSTLRSLRDYGAQLTIYCKTSYPTWCGNSWDASMDQLIQYFGYDFDPVAERGRFLGRFVCEKCGQRNVQTVWSPPDDTPGMMRGMASYRYSRPDDETMARLRREGEDAERAIQAQIAEFAAYRKRFKAEDKARQAIESGRDLIGPPNPFSGRKGHRPKMR